MKVVLIATLFLFAAVYCQTQNKNGNPTGEIGQPAFDEIVVESTLTVRGKSGSRSGKSLVNDSPQKSEALSQTSKAEIIDGSSAVQNRNRRDLSDRFRGGGAKKIGFYPLQPFGSHFPSSSLSSAQASSNSFNSNSPFGNFGASASQSSSQSQSFGPTGFEGSAGQSASQTYHLPNGSKVDVAFSNSYSVNNGKPSFANSHSFTITSPDGKIHKRYG